MVLTHDVGQGLGPGHLEPAGGRPGGRPLAGLPPAGPHRRPVGGDPVAGHRHALHRARAASTPARSSARPGSGATLVSLVATALGRVDASGVPDGAAGRRRAPRRLPANVVTTYGMTETGSGVVYDGTPLDGVEVRIGDGAVGRGGRGPGPGPDAAARLPRRVGPPDRRRLAAHRGRRPAGAPTATLTVFGRMAEVIVTGGEKVWPAPGRAGPGRPSRRRPGGGVEAARPRVGRAGGGLGGAGRPGGAPDARGAPRAGGRPTWPGGPPPVSWWWSARCPGPRAARSVGPTSD